MRTLIPLTLLLVAFAQGCTKDSEAAPVFDESKATPLPLYAGEAQLLPLTGVSRISQSNESVAKVKLLDGEKVLVEGLKFGKSGLTVWQKNGEQHSYLVDVTDNPRPVKPYDQRAEEVVIEKPTILLKVGEQKDAASLVQFPLSRIAMADPTIASLETSAEGKVTLHALKEGQTTFLVWTNDGARNEHNVVVSR